MATSRIYRTQDAGDRTQWTWSGWIKPSPQDGTTYGMTVFCAYKASDNYTELAFDNSGSIDYLNVTNGSTDGRLTTNRKFRDCGAWMHVVAVWDSDNASAGDRMKLYINGVEETDFSDDTNPSSGLESIMNKSTHPVEIGSRAEGANFFRGVMCHVNFVNAAALAPTAFGETDTDGMWKIKTSPSVTYGTNGYFLKMEDSTNLDLDSSSNAYTFTSAGELTYTKDTASNNFCQLSPIAGNYSSGTGLSNDAGLQFVGTQGNAWRAVYATLCFNSGKYYYEVKINTVSTNNQYNFGFTSVENIVNAALTDTIGSAGVGAAAGIRQDGDIKYATESAASQTSVGWGSTFTAGDIVSCAIDCDNNFVYFGVNGTWMNSGNPASGATGTGGFAIDNATKPMWTAIIACNETASGSTNYLGCNFGAGTFPAVSGAPVTVTSEGTNASGNGIFEYDVPTGYGAICTKQINGD